MSNQQTLFSDFIVEDDRRYPHPDLPFVLLQLEQAGKIIGSHIRKSALVDIHGSTEQTNTSGDEIKKIDFFANDVITNILLESGQVFAIGSEEHETLQYAKSEKQGDYIVYFDPMDGSANVESNMPCGTIFSIYHKRHGLNQKGEKQIAAGYILYSAAMVFVYTSGNGVHEFTFDPSSEKFFLTKESLRIPRQGLSYAINEGYGDMFLPHTKDYLLKQKKQSILYKTSYSGCLVADAHKVLIMGGIYLYPATSKHPNGKIRLMYEINPFSFILNQAGGLSTSEGVDPLTIEPIDIHQQIPIALGSKDNITEYLSFIR